MTTFLDIEPPLANAKLCAQILLDREEMDELPEPVIYLLGQLKEHVEEANKRFYAVAEAEQARVAGLEKRGA